MSLVRVQSEEPDSKKARLMRAFLLWVLRVVSSGLPAHGFLHPLPHVAGRRPATRLMAQPSEQSPRRMFVTATRRPKYSLILSTISSRLTEARASQRTSSWYAPQKRRSLNNPAIAYVPANDHAHNYKARVMRALVASCGGLAIPQT